MRTLDRDAEDTLVKWFKLTSYEARAYLALLNGCKTPREVAKRAKIPYTRVYDVIRSLESKGFVMLGGDEISVLKPENALLNRIIQLDTAYEEERREREKVAKNLAKTLKPMVREKPEETIVKLLRGIPVILAKMLETCSKSNNIVFTIRKSFRIKDSVKPLLLSLEPSRRKITFILDRDIELSEEDKEFIEAVGAEVIRGNIMLDMLIADGNETIIGVPTSSDDAVAVWIKDREFSESVKRYLTRENLLPP